MNCENKIPLPIPKMYLSEMFRNWISLVLAVCYHTEVSHYMLLKHNGRHGKELGSARRLLIWCLFKIAEGNKDMVIAWVEEVMVYGRKSVIECLKGIPPTGIRDVMDTYVRLCSELKPADVTVAIGAGLIGQRKPLARLWPKGFLEKLGLESKQAGLKVAEPQSADVEVAQEGRPGTPGSPAIPS